MKKSIAYGLIAIVLFSLFVRLTPLFQFSFWGVDCGEYVYYTNQLLKGQELYLSSDGWADAYPYFPGMFILAGTFTSLTGISVLHSTVFFPVFVSSLVPLFTFGLVYKITRFWKPAILASLFLTVIAPFLYNYSQPKPETIGFFLMLFLLLLAVMISRTKKVLILMVISGAALTVSHHLSSYFFMLFLIGGIFFSELGRRETVTRDRYRLYFYLYFATSTILYWAFFATPFVKNRFLNAFFLPSYLILLTPYIFVIVYKLIIIRRRQYDFICPINIHRQTLKGFLLVSIPILIVSTSLLIYSGFVNIPGREIVIGSSVLLYMPLLILGLPSIFARKIIKAFSDGLHPLGWIVFSVISFLVGVITGSTSLLPMRQVSFILLPLSIFFGLGTVQLYYHINPELDKKKCIAFLSVLLLLFSWSIPIAYPSQEMANGYQEGTGWHDIEAGFWIKGVSGKVATSHRLSASFFALSNKNLTWIYGKAIYFSSDTEEVLDEIDEMQISYILWDSDMKRGVTTKPGAQPRPINDRLLEHYHASYCLYRSEEVEVHKV